MITISDETNEKIRKVLTEIWDQTQNEEVGELLDILERKELYLYHFQETEHAGEGVIEDRFVWAVDSDSARDELEAILDAEEVGWDIDNFECSLVYDQNGDEVVKKVGAE